GSISRRTAGFLASSFLLARGRRLFDLNSREWRLPLSKWDKLLVGGYIILKDFSDGQFPLKFDDRARAHQAEIDYYRAIPGASVEDNIESHGRKPFWGADGFSKYSADFVRLLRTLNRLGLRPGCNLLQMG